MKDKSGIIIYVGKAKNLKSRVSSYFNNKHTGKTALLVSNIADFEYILTSSDLEALLLEINLIKKYDPKYNIMLRDDKTYPYIEITNENIPRLIIVRPKNKKKIGKIFGPYPNVYAARKIVEILNRIYPLRKCVKMPKKVCLYYHIGECLGYCEKDIDKKTIDNMISDITKFLNGNHHILSNKLKQEMEEASNKLNFERAKEMKEYLEYINITLRTQKIDLNDNIDRDIFGYYIYKGFICIQVLFLRNGKLVERDYNIYEMIDDEIDTMTYFISTFYEFSNVLPKEILIPAILDKNLIESAINIKTTIPIRGKKKQLLDMSIKNAKRVLEEKFEIINRSEDAIKVSLDELKSKLDIEDVSRIEIFDNSQLFGTLKVSGMVVFTLGKPNKKEYRKYKINTEHKDDYNIMKEVIYRRYYRVLLEKLEKPNLIIVDGGKIQVNAATSVLSSLNLDIPVCGLIKDDKHNTNSLLYKNEIIEIQRSSNLFHFLERIQDEVHKFTINYHKNIRSKSAISSVLDNIPGIGEERKKKLLKRYGDIDTIKTKTIEELEEVIPKNVAISLLNHLNLLDGKKNN